MEAFNNELISLNESVPFRLFTPFSHAFFVSRCSFLLSKIKQNLIIYFMRQFFVLSCILTILSCILFIFYNVVYFLVIIKLLFYIRLFYTKRGIKLNKCKINVNANSLKPRLFWFIAVYSITMNHFSRSILVFEWHSLIEFSFIKS